MSATHCPNCGQDWCSCDEWIQRCAAARRAGYDEGFRAAIESALVNARIHEADLRRMAAARRSA